MRNKPRIEFPIVMREAGRHLGIFRVLKELTGSAEFQIQQMIIEDGSQHKIIFGKRLGEFTQCIST